MRATALVAALLAVACQKSSGEAAPAAAPAAQPEGTATGPSDPSAPAATPPGAHHEDVVGRVVRAEDRSEADRALDAGRQPQKLLEFFAIKPGMHVAELGAGTGYTTELLARLVGPKGRVYAQNSPFILERFAEGPLSERLEKPALSNVVRVDREFDDPLPPSATNLDAVLNVLFYHDSVWMKVDRDAMNRAVHAALKPGGVYGIVDHDAKSGAGVEDAKTLHRIEKSVVIEEVQRAGFRLKAEADFLRNAKDAHDWNASPSAAGERRGTSDRFVLAFVKPE